MTTDGLGVLALNEDATIVGVGQSEGLLEHLRLDQEFGWTF